MTKTCVKCGIEKPLEEFYKHKMMADGHLNKCMTCVRRDNGNHWRSSYAYRQSHVARERQKRALARQRTYRHKDPEKTRTRAAVTLAKKDGRLKPPFVCEYCSDGDSLLEAHHWDYSRPFDVTWLCKRCHRIADIARAEAERKIRRKEADEEKAG